MKQERYVQVIGVQRCMVDNPEHEVKVTRINDAWHCRVYVQGEVNQEAKCFHRANIGYTCRSLLRWEDKCGNISKLASSARARLNTKTQQVDI